MIVLIVHMAGWVLRGCSWAARGPMVNINTWTPTHESRLAIAVHRRTARAWRHTFDRPSVRLQVGMSMSGWFWP